VQFEQQIETDLHRVILLASNGAEVLVRQDHARLDLPAVPIPRHQRVAENLTAFMRREWSQDAVSLFALNPSSINSETRYQVTESIVAQRSAVAGFRWVSVSSLQESQFEEADDCAAIARALAQCQECAAGRERGPFAKLRWFAELTEWVREQIRPAGLILSGRFTQLNASATFSLVRFETNGPAVWFKAVGEPNLREYPITLTLAKYFPAFVPRVIATRQDWNAWLAVEIPGAHPNENSEVGTWPRIAAKLAELQLSSHGQALHLINDGCRDVRVNSLLDLVTPFLEAMRGFMEKQTKPVPTPLCYRELLSIGDTLREALFALEDCDIPNAVGHLDFNPGNVLVSPNECVFLDWAEACVGHPFFTLQYVLEHARRMRGADQSQEESITLSYAKTWEALVERNRIAAALQASSLCAVFAYAAHHPGWRNRETARRPEAAAYLRSLTRRMKRESDTLRERRVVCVS
jgi:thiamine kinase-like enzyme